MDIAIRRKVEPARIKPRSSKLTLSGYLYEVECAGNRGTCLDLTAAWRLALWMVRLHQLAETSA
jgi:hypothetical protein